MKQKPDFNCISSFDFGSRQFLGSAYLSLHASFRLVLNKKPVVVVGSTATALPKHNRLSNPTPHEHNNDFARAIHPYPGYGMHQLLPS